MLPLDESTEGFLHNVVALIHVWVNTYGCICKTKVLVPEDFVYKSK